MGSCRHRLSEVQSQRLVSKGGWDQVSVALSLLYGGCHLAMWFSKWPIAGAVIWSHSGLWGLVPAHNSEQLLLHKVPMGDAKPWDCMAKGHIRGHRARESNKGLVPSSLQDLVSPGAQMPPDSLQRAGGLFAWGF